MGSLGVKLIAKYRVSAVVSVTVQSSFPLVTLLQASCRHVTELDLDISAQVHHQWVLFKASTENNPPASLSFQGPHFSSD
jgi:hypothetical protein